MRTIQSNRDIPFRPAKHASARMWPVNALAALEAPRFAHDVGGWKERTTEKTAEKCRQFRELQLPASLAVMPRGLSHCVAQLDR